MPLYQFYPINEDGLRSYSEDVACDDDAAAILVASHRASAEGRCDVWIGTRSLGSFPYLPQTAA